MKALIVASLLAACASAQSYSFSVPSFVCNASLEADGTLLVYYEIVFECAPGAHAIDIVDIGFPTDSYERSSVAAAMDGAQVTDIRESSYIPIGVEIHLGDRSIQPGRSGTLTLSGRNPGMVYRDPSSPDRAALEFSPTWFDGSLLSGTSRFVLRFQFPPGADSASVQYFGRPFSSAYSAEGRMIYEWDADRAVSSEYMIGVSFPAGLVSCRIQDVPPAVTAKTRTSAGGGSAGGAAFAPLCMGVALPVGMILLVVVAVRNSRKRRVQYMPPTIGVEGVGIKRGLTAPQASMLLEQPLDRVLRLVIFGLLLKDAVRIEESDGKPVFREGGGDSSGLWDYEKALLTALKVGVPGRGALDREALGKMFIGMVKDLQTRMKGFSVRETRDYYKSITAQAWKQVAESAAGGEIESIVSERMEWLLLDPDFEKRAERLPPQIMVFPARMGGFYRPLVSTGGGISIPRFCSDVAGSLEHFAGGIVGSFESIASSVTAVTNPVPVSSYSSSGHSGGGCACACACAGCACACAGGGR